MAEPLREGDLVALAASSSPEDVGMVTNIEPRGGLLIRFNDGISMWCAAVDLRLLQPFTAILRDRDALERWLGK